jgi:hypothetical protein
VQARGRLRGSAQLRQACEQALERAQERGAGASVLARELELRLEPLRPEELGPARVGTVRLRQ